MHLHMIARFVSPKTCSDEPPTDEAPPGGLTDADLDSNWDEAIETFDAMEIPEELLRGIFSYGFEKPSAIQQRAIKPTMLGRDLIAQAQSGTVRLGLLIALDGEDDSIQTIPSFESEKSYPRSV